MKPLTEGDVFLSESVCMADDEIYLIEKLYIPNFCRLKISQIYMLFTEDLLFYWKYILVKATTETKAEKMLIQNET